METLKDRRAWTIVLQTLRDHRCQPRLLFPAKLSITIDGENMTFWAGDIVQELRALAVLPEDLSSTPSTHMAAHNYL